MKKYLHIIGFVFTLMFSAQELTAQNEISSGLITAFKNADANAIAPYLNDNVELIIPQTDNFFTRQHAKSILADFFRKNPVKDFLVVHKGTKENASFLIATYISTTGSYRVSLFARKTDNQLLVYQLRIEKAE